MPPRAAPVDRCAPRPSKGPSPCTDSPPISNSSSPRPATTTTACARPRPRVSTPSRCGSHGRGRARDPQGPAGPEGRARRDRRAAHRAARRAADAVHDPAVGPLGVLPQARRERRDRPRSRLPRIVVGSGTASAAGSDRCSSTSSSRSTGRRSPRSTGRAWASCSSRSTCAWTTRARSWTARPRPCTSPAASSRRTSACCTTSTTRPWRARTWRPSSRTPATSSTTCSSPMRRVEVSPARRARLERALPAPARQRLRRTRGPGVLPDHRLRGLGRPRRRDCACGMSARNYPASVDVVIVGSGPTGAAYARILSERAPGTTIAMFEVGPTVSDPPGAHVKNIADPAERARAQVASEGPGERGQKVANPGAARAGVRGARPGTFLLDDGYAFEGEDGMPVAAMSEQRRGHGRALDRCLPATQRQRAHRLPRRPRRAARRGRPPFWG